MRHVIPATLGLASLATGWITGCGTGSASNDEGTDGASSSSSGSTTAASASSSGPASTGSSSSGAVSDASSSSSADSGTGAEGADTSSAVCGDGIVDEGESCDDGGATDVCDASCGWVPGGLRWTAAIPGLYARACVASDAVLLVGGSYEADTLDAMIVEFGLDGPSLDLRPVDGDADDSELDALAIGDDGSVYAAGERGSFRTFSIAGHAWAVDSSFEPLWDTTTLHEGQPVSTTTNVAVSGDVLVLGSTDSGFFDGVVARSSLAGQPQWSRAMSGTLRDLEILEDGSIVAAGSGGVTMFSPDGETVSPLAEVEAIAIAPFEAGLVLAQESGGLVGLSLAGAELWAESTPHGDLVELVLDGDGNIDVLGANADGFVLFELDGEELADPDVDATTRWSHEFESTGSNPITGDLAIGPDRVVFLCGTTGGRAESVVLAISG